MIFSAFCFLGASCRSSKFARRERSIGGKIGDQWVWASFSPGGYFETEDWIGEESWLSS